MEMTYDVILKYMYEYFEAFNKYGQNPDTIHRMDDYFAPDFEFHPYIAYIKPVVGREEWYRVLLSHPSGFEKLNPLDIVIDERRKIVDVLIEAEISDTRTGEVLVKKHYFAHYPLVLDDNNTIKIKELRFFWEILPEGTLDIEEVFARNRK